MYTNDQHVDFVSIRAFRDALFPFRSCRATCQHVLGPFELYGVRVFLFRVTYCIH